MIIWDNQAFTLLMLERWGVGEQVGLLYANERWKEGRRPGRRLQWAHNPQQRLQEKKKKTAADTHLKRIYNSSASLGGLSTCFMTGTLRGVISAFFFFFFTCDTYKAPKRLISSCKGVSLCQSRRWGKVGVEVGSRMET